MKAKVLLVDDDENYLNGLRVDLANDPIELVWAATAEEGIRTYSKNIHGYSAVILDYCLPDQYGTEVAKHLRRLNPSQQFLFATGYPNPEYLIDLLETGGSQGFLLKGKSSEESRDRILKTIRSHEMNNRVLGCDDYSPSKAEVELRSVGILGKSKIMYPILRDLRCFREARYPILLVGPTGIGKEFIARAMVPPGQEPIIIDCTKFTQKADFLESHLFGHVKGAYTGATEDKRGVFATAGGKVVFLDELHTMSIAAQAMLLRFLETGKFQRMGDPTGPLNTPWSLG